MSHTHVSDHPTTAESSVRQVKALRLMIVILIPIAIWTVVGLVWLWPHHTDAHIREDTSTYSAKGVTLPKGEITKVQPMSCEGQAGTSSGGGQGEQPSCATITVKLLEGPEQGQQTDVVLTSAQYGSGVHVGQKVKLFRVPPAQGADGKASYQFSDFDRSVPLIALAVAFAIAVIVVARWRGFASLIGLAFAGFILIEFMFPALVSGQNPLLVGLIGSSAIMFVVLYAAHGFSARTTTALVGTLFGLLLTAGLGWAVGKWAHLTGVATEDDYLLAASAPDLTLNSVVLCGIIIAGLGVLNDVTITQASAVWELAESDPDQQKLFSRAMRIGRDHIASSVYTIAFATAGAGLSALLLITVYGRPLTEVAQTEALAEEIIRTLVGAIGLVLAMPLTTAIGVAVVRAGKLGRHPAAETGRADAEPESRTGEIGARTGTEATSAEAASSAEDSFAATAAAKNPSDAGTDVGAAPTRVRPTAATTAPMDDRETTELPRIRRAKDASTEQQSSSGRRSRRAHDDDSFNFADLREDDEDEQPRGRRWR
ncbi:YibE/F family protein [Microlunatus elymi]|uniref:YibE/F family protein n=1 Tax=Microlunatus elymi TaxID=2596828 RepID=A0A516PU43_9ACTN|nr:YibE/F family protein [Microlunatus elymi]QDP94663.1 YibE/F family protein [Microlunatus elymi]